MEDIKNILVWLLIFVVGSLIVSFLINPESFNKFENNIKGYFNQKTENTNSGILNSGIICGTKVKDLIPKYILFGDKNYWKDKELIDIYESNYGTSNCLRFGTEKGENINYSYYNNECSGFKYEKRIVSNNGKIKGDKTFLLNNIVLNKIDTNFKWEGYLYKIFNNTEGGHVEGEEDIYKASWEGFDSEIKEMLNIKSIKIKIYSQQYYIANIKGNGNKVFCEEEIIEEKGSFECKIDPTYFDNSQKPVYSKELNMLLTGPIKNINVGQELVVEISPNIVEKDIYEIIDYDIINCNWVE